MEEEEACQGHEEEVIPLYTIVFHYIFPVLITLGILTNTLNLIVLTHPLMKGRTYRWLRALACVDLCLCVFTIPVCVAKGGIQPLQSKLISFYYAYFGWSVSTAWQIISFYLMGMFALERYLAVCRHDLYPRSQTHRVFLTGCFSAIAFVFALYLPTVSVGRVVPVGDKWLPRDGYTQQEQSWYWGYAWLRELFSRLLPVILITFCNLRIIVRLRQLRNIRESFGSVSSSRKEKQRRLVLLLFWVTLLFYIFNAPVTVYYLGFLHSRTYCQNNNIPAALLTFAAISNLLQMIGNVSNFVLYFLISPEFHKTLCIVLCGCFSTARKKTTTTTTTTTTTATASTTTTTTPCNNAQVSATTTTVIAAIIRGCDKDLQPLSDAGSQADVATGSTSSVLYANQCYIRDAETEEG